jgi:hypothetical protein
MSTVAMSKVQERFSKLNREVLSPGSGTIHTTPGVIVEVYDQEKLEKITLTDELKRKTEAYPGLLFAKVVLATRRTLILPFKEPEDHIFLTYGNSTQLEGRGINIEYDGMNLEGGKISLQKIYREKQVNVPQVTRIFDIGALI